VTYITLLVKGGASVKEAQELARHCDPKLTMNVYTQLGMHDLSGALDCLPGVGTDETKPDVLRATGTCDSTPRHLSQQLGRETVQPGAAGCGESRQAASAEDSRKSLSVAALRSGARRGAAECDKATGRTRTDDLRFTNRATRRSRHVNDATNAVSGLQRMFRLPPRAGFCFTRG